MLMLMTFSDLCGSFDQHKSTIQGQYIGRQWRNFVIPIYISCPLWSRDQGIGSHHITSHGKDGCRPQWPLYPRNK